MNLEVYQKTDSDELKRKYKKRWLFILALKKRQNDDCNRNNKYDAHTTGVGYTYLLQR